MFSSGFTGYTNSMQGFWSGMVRLATVGHWFGPHWWPYHDAGSPFEWTYAPAAPGLAALWSAAAGIEPIRGVQAASGLIYCLGPVTLFLFCALATRRVWWSFATAVGYSLLAPTEWVVPDGTAAWQSIGDARRLYLMAVWDETPHYAAMALLPLILLSASRAMESNLRRYWLATTVLLALSLMTSAFGATASGIGMICVLFAFGRKNALRNWTTTAICSVAAWALASPSLPPSLIFTIRENAAVHGDSGWDPSGLTALAITIAGAVVVLILCDRGGTGWWPRFVGLFAWTTTAIPLLFLQAGRHFLPQPGRYKIEAELGLILLAALAFQTMVDRFPRKLQVALALVGLALAAEGVVKHRRYEKLIVRDKPYEETLESKVAQWASANIPQARIALPGSLAMWFNASANGQQFSGSSYSTAYNPVQQMAWLRWISATTPAEAADSLLWLRAFGAYAFAVPGPESGEFWKALGHPELYDGCEALWQDHKTTICRVPGGRQSLAWSVPGEAVVGARPKSSSDTGAVRRYTAALDAAPESIFEWRGTEAASIRTAMRPGERLSVQISWHPGWNATANGRPVAVSPDGLGLTVVDTHCEGTCDVRLAYRGGAELWICHALRWATIAGLLTWGAIAHRRARGIASAARSEIR